MPDFEKIISAIEAVLKLVFGDQVPPWIFTLMGYILLLALILIGIWGLLVILSKIKKIWTEEFHPLFYNPEGKRRVQRRQRFADHIESEIRRLNNLEIWSDYRFAELEAEVEAEGQRQAFGAFPFFPRTQSGLRRERSLSSALELSNERLILLEGEPGSGKSVALRHIAQVMARRAMKSRGSKTVIPIYINLKELEQRRGAAGQRSAPSGGRVREEQPVDKNLIRGYILKFINRANDRDIEEFLEEEFDWGLREGTWLFLFDSFDELPEVLTSTEADKTIRNYADAISDFLHGMNQCRGIVASRQFRGPGQLGWPRFRILPLSEERRRRVICKADLKPDLQAELLGRVGTARDEIRAMANNPMFLGLLCEHVRAGHPFPENVHSVFETYIQTRLTRDAERLQRRFQLDPGEVRLAAEYVAFCMAADPGLGLSPTRSSIDDSMTRMGFKIKANFDTLLDALEYIKLARSETAVSVGESKPFTFSHRRFQEYFATCVVLRDPDRVSSRQLLTDARWRETAIALCQTQPPEVLSPIIDEAQRLLTDIADSLPGLIDDPTEYVSTPLSERDNAVKGDISFPILFAWPRRTLHILGLLQDGFGNRLEQLPDGIRICAARLIVSSRKTGTLSDWKWGLEVAGIAPLPVLLWLLRRSFATGSRWLREVAYRQTARLRVVPSDIANSIYQALAGLAIDGRLFRERHATHAHLTRLDKFTYFIAAARLLLWIPLIDLGLHVAMSITLLTGPTGGISLSPLRGLAFISLFFSYLGLWWATRALPWLGFGYTRMESWFAFVVQLRLLLGAWLVLVFWKLQYTMPLLLLSAYMISWAPFALFSARMGRFTHPLDWPLIPIMLLPYFARNAGKDLINALNRLRALWKDWTLIIFFLVLTSLIGYSHDTRVILGIMGGILYVFLTCATLWALDRIRAWFRWYRCTHSRQAPMTVYEFLESLNSIHLSVFRIELARSVREQGLLMATADTELLLEQLVLAIEHALRKRSLWYSRSVRERGIIITSLLMEVESMTRSLSLEVERVRSRQNARPSEARTSRQEQSPPTASDFFEHWLAKFTKMNKWRLAVFGVRFLEEICMLLEQVRASRRDGT